MQGKILRFSILFILIVSGSFSTAAAGDFTLDGSVKSYFYIFQPPSVQGAAGRSSAEALSSSRVRIQAAYTPSAWMRLEAAYDLAPRIQSRGLENNVLFPGTIDPFVYRAVDPDPLLYPSEQSEVDNFALGHNLDRASATFRSRPADVTFGRQAIAWGSAHAVNPTDVLAPFSFDTLDTEDRIGIDAVRARIPIGVLSEIDIGYVFGKDFKFSNSAFFTRTAFNVLGTDLSILLMGFRENILFGFDLARSVGGAGYWLETAYVFADAMNGEQNSAAKDYARVSTGMDYNLTGTLYGFVEYHFNGAGASQPGDYLGQSAETAYTEGSVYLLGRHYIIPGIVYQCTPLITLTGQSLINAADPSVYLAPQLDYNIASNVYMGVGAFIGVGSGPVPGDSQLPVLQSEFGAYPNTYFASLRYYF